jgi:hypothetical protein
MLGVRLLCLLPRLFYHGVYALCLECFKQALVVHLEQLGTFVGVCGTAKEFYFS